VRVLLTAGLALFAALSGFDPGRYNGPDSARPAGIDFHALTESSNIRAGSGSADNRHALREMLGDPLGPQRWRQPPKLTILVSVMEYRTGGDVEYVATDEQLSDADVAELLRDLTEGLGVMTANTFEQYSSVGREVVPAGSTAKVSRPGEIVAGRFSGLQRSMKTLGFGGRRARRDGTITAGAVLLDSEFDRTSAKRRLLRTHELGHALGYNHVHSRTSIMNPRIGSEPNEFDRAAALSAFRAPALAASR
jgi:hypothetical protein